MSITAYELGDIDSLPSRDIQGIVVRAMVETVDIELPEELTLEYSDPNKQRRVVQAAARIKTSWFLEGEMSPELNIVR